MWGLYKGFGVNPSVTLQKESKLEYTETYKGPASFPPWSMETLSLRYIHK